MAILIFILGLILGSFLSAYTYRAPRDISINKGRSFCSRCKKQINWYDNIPVISYIILGGKCRNCHKKISLRYPLIELTTALTLTLIYLYSPLISSNISWSSNLPYLLATSYYLLITSIMLVIIVTDLEHQIILDEVVFIAAIATLTLQVLFNPPYFYNYLFAGTLAANLLLFLNLITKGRGMGLGDVKLALLVGLIFGIIGSLIWLFMSFVTGSIVGIILIMTDQKNLKSKIAFGPFLVFSFFLYLLFGQIISQTLFPIF